MPQIPTFTSSAGYDAAPVPQQNPAAAGIAGNALAEGMARVSGQFAQVWQAQRQAADAATGLAKFAEYRNAATDLSTRYANDPDPATVPARFKADLEKLAETSGAGLSAGPAAYLKRMVLQHAPALYSEMAHHATTRNTQNLLASVGQANDTLAQQLAAATTEPDIRNAALAIKQGSAGAEASGLIGQGGATRLYSHALRTAITIRAAAGDAGAAPAAQALLERFKGEMTGDDVAALSTGLRGPLERAQGETAATAAIALSGEVTGRARAVEAAFIAKGYSPAVARGLAANAVQESGANPNPQAGDGGRSTGLFQWNGDRRAAFVAQYGIDPGQATLQQQVDFADWELKNTEKTAGTALAAATTPEQAAKIASTQFLRPRDTAAEEPRRAGIATQLGGGIQGQRDAAVADVRARLSDAPLHVRLSAESQVAEHFTHLEGQQSQARALLGQQLHDLEAAYSSGQTTAAVPEDRIRALAPNAEAAQRTIDGLNLTRTAGDAIKAVAFASPADVAAQRARLAGNPQDTYLAAERGQLVAHFDQSVARMRTALKDDPAGYAMTAPEVQQLAKANAPLPEIVAASLAAQGRMGVLPGAQRVLSGDQLTRLTDTLRTTGPDKADMGATLSGIAQQFGPALWNQAFGELVHHGKLPWEWQAVAAMSEPQQVEGRALLQQALKFEGDKGGHEALRKLVAPDVMKGFDAEVDSAMSNFREAVRLHPGGDALFDTMRRAVDTLATFHAFRGMKASAAAERAYQDVVGARWDTAGDDGSGLFGRTPTMLVPKGQAGPIETALDLARNRLTAAELQALPDPGRPDAAEPELARATLAAARRGIWVNNADASGAVLRGRTPGGSIVNLTRTDGRPIEVRFNALPQQAPDEPGVLPEDGTTGGGPRR